MLKLRKNIMKKETNKLIKMPNKSFDKFMCEKYPQIFQDRNKPMSVTAMCWGFNVGKGWNELLHNLCEKIDKFYFTVKRTENLKKKSYMSY